jgi:hypothetical protein
MAVELHHFVYAKEWVLTGYQPRIEPLLEIAAAFGKNMLRIHSLGSLPIHVASAASLAQLCGTEAMVILNIESTDTRIVDGHVDFDPALHKALQEQRKKLMKRQYDAAREGKVTHPFKIAEENIGPMLAFEPLKTGADAVLGGMIVGCWTAFETLAADLWKAALNIHPTVLAALTGRWHKPSKMDPDQLIEDDSEQIESKTVKLNDLQMHNYDVSKIMGNIHRNRFKWGVLEGIRTAYSSAFSKDFTDIQTAIEDRSLDALAAARNVLVHKAGIVDVEFNRKCKGWPAFANAVPNTSLMLDGFIVRDLLSEALQQTINLLKGVDLWLDSH